MAGIEDLKTDENIAKILRKLKGTSAPSSEAPNDAKATSDKSADADGYKSLEVPATDIKVNQVNNVVSYKQPVKEAPTEESPSIHKSFADKSILPWFSKADRDLDKLHYIKMNESGYLEYCSIKESDKSDENVATLQMSEDYLCDIDYYNSNHYVLYIKRLDSDYGYNRTYTTEALNDSASNPTLAKTDSDDIELAVMHSNKYSHYVVFTDLGVADFIVKDDDVSCLCDSSNDMNKWFEEVSNRVQLKLPNFNANNHIIRDDVANIQNFKYDIVTMHVPGVITIDSVDNNDPEYQVHIALKDEFGFLPLNRVLGCIKLYASSDKKGIDDFRRFINRYFDIVQ